MTAPIVDSLVRSGYLAWEDIWDLLIERAGVPLWLVLDWVARGADLPDHADESLRAMMGRAVLAKGAGGVDSVAAGPAE
ncbi:MAG: hypothetical protein ACR2M1_15800 [Gemmatimonadaceae bacterium]